MSDFKFLQNSVSGKWVVSAPRRAERPDVAKGTNILCPFCPGREKEEKEVYRIDKDKKELICKDNLGCIVDDSSWLVRVLPNKFPFAPIHEVIVHSPEHHKNFGELPVSAVELVFKAYRQRYQTHSKYGQVYIFNNSGKGSGESLLHPHSQLVVIPNNVSLEIEPPEKDLKSLESIKTDHFYIFCPDTSEWPDETWIASKGLKFGNITDGEISDLASSISRLIQILTLRHNGEFPFNFYIYPGDNWYLRIMPRLKSLGGFELGTRVFVNTQDPKETMAFLKEHFENPDEEKIKSTQQALYKKAV